MGGGRYLSSITCSSPYREHANLERNRPTSDSCSPIVVQRLGIPHSGNKNHDNARRTTNGLRDRSPRRPPYENTPPLTQCVILLPLPI